MAPSPLPCNLLFYSESQTKLKSHSATGATTSASPEAPSAQAFVLRSSGSFLPGWVSSRESETSRALQFPIMRFCAPIAVFFSANDNDDDLYMPGLFFHCLIPHNSSACNPIFLHHFPAPLALRALIGKRVLLFSRAGFLNLFRVFTIYGLNWLFKLISNSPPGGGFGGNYTHNYEKFF